MAQHNGKSFTDFTGVSVGSNGLRFDANRTAAEDSSTEQSIYVRGDALKFWSGTAETDLITGVSGGVSTWDSLYDLDKAMTLDDGTVTFSLTDTTANGLTFTSGVTATGNIIDITNSGTGKDIDGTASTWHITKAGVITGTSVVLGDDQVIAFGATTDGQIQWVNASSYIDIDGATNFDGNMIIEAAHTLTIAGAGGATKFSITAGDTVISDGSVAITDADNAATLSVTNATVTTGNTVVITADAATEGSILYIDNGGASLTTGYYINCNDDGTADFSVGVDGATIITTAVNSTQALKISGIQTSENMVLLDNATGVQASDTAILKLDAGGNNADGSNMIRLAPTGTPVEGSIGIEFVGASKLMQALNIDGDSVANSVVVLNGGGAIADNKAVLEVKADGTPAATGSNVVRIDGSGATATNKPTLLEIDGHGKDEIGLFIDADSVGNVALINGGGNIANDTGVLQLTADGGTQSAGGTVLRVVNSGTPNAGSIGIEGVFTSKDMYYMYMAGASATNSAVFITSTGAVATTKAVLEVTSTGTPAATTSDVARFTFSGTATNSPRVVEIVGDGKDCTGLYVDTDATTNSNNYLHADGALAANKAVLEIVSDAAAGNADSAVLRVDQADAAGVANVVQLVQADVNIPFISFEATIGVGNAIEAAGGKALTATHYVMVDIEGVGPLYLPVGTIA